jgi:hypothetical protein
MFTYCIRQHLGCKGKRGRDTVKKGEGKRLRKRKERNR